MQDNELMKLLKTETVYLPDAGFSQRVIEALPRTAGYRRRVIGISWFFSLLAGLFLWSSGGPSLQPGVLLSAATLAFFVMLGFFVFVAKDEGILDI